MSAKEPNKHTGRAVLQSKKYFSFLVFVVVAACLSTTLSVFAGIAPDADRTFLHPSEDNQTKNLTLTSGVYTFETDANPNGYHCVDWYNTYSGGTPVETAYLYYYDDYDFSLTTSGWVRAEIYKSDIWNNRGAWEASYRWYITIQLPSYTVNASAGTGGTVSPSSRTVTQGNTTTFTVYPATGYTHGSVSGDAAGGSWNGNTYTTAPVTQNRNLTFSFVVNTYTVNATAGTGGTVSPSSRSVTHGNTTTFTVYPATGYTHGSVSGDASGGSWNGNTYTTAPVTQNRNLTFNFIIPDLIVTSVWTEPAQPVQGQSYVIKATVKNQGTAEAYASGVNYINVRFYVDGADKGEEIDWNYRIAAGDSYTYTSQTLTVPVVGAHTMKAVADSHNHIVESNENNNEGTGTFTVAGVTALSFRNSSGGVISQIEVGQTVYLRADAVGMNGQTVNVELWEDDGVGDDLILTAPITIGSSGYGTYPWNAVWQELDGDSPENSYYLYYSPGNVYSGSPDTGHFLVVPRTGNSGSGPERGNAVSQEYGDALYDKFDLLNLGYNYNHAGLLAGIDSSGTIRTFESSTDDFPEDPDNDPSMGPQEGNFQQRFKDEGADYYGAFIPSTYASTMPFSDRKSVVSKGREVVDADISYPYITFNALNYNGTTPIDPFEISSIRCDGLVEYSYERVGIRVWASCIKPDGEWNIAYYPDNHNNNPGTTVDPEFELSPWAQRGATTSSTTGPGYSSPPWPDTKMTKLSVINLPTIQFTQLLVTPTYADIEIRATDESGVFKILGEVYQGGVWTSVTSQQNPLRHPTADSYTIQVRIAGQPGTSLNLHAKAQDHGGNWSGWVPTTITFPNVYYNLTTEVQGQGSISPYPGGSYVSGTTVPVTATANTVGWHFARWEGDKSGSINPTTIVMDSNKDVTAVFEEDMVVYSLTVTIQGQGSVSLNPPGGIYDSGTMVQVTAIPSSWFVRWEEDLSGSSNPETILMDANKSITAIFELPQIIGDLNLDGRVDFLDLSLFTNDWLMSIVCEGSDFDCNGIVNFADFSIFAQHWLEGI